jgi:hypothetical protein
LREGMARRKGGLLPCLLPPRPQRSTLLDQLAWLQLGLLPAAPRRLATEPEKLLMRLASEPGMPAELFVGERPLPCIPPLRPAAPTSHKPIHFASDNRPPLPSPNPSGNLFVLFQPLSFSSLLHPSLSITPKTFFYAFSLPNYFSPRGRMGEWGRVGWGD